MSVNARDLFEAMGMVDEDLVEAADADLPRPAWTPVKALRRVLPAAACVCLAGAAVLAWSRGYFAPKGGTSLDSGLTTGATASEVAKVAKKFGAEKVKVLTFASTRYSAGFSGATPGRSGDTEEL